MPGPIRLLADASLNQGIVSGCVRREPTMDFQSAHEAKLKSVSDPEVIRIAASLNRILVTSDLKTMPRHFADFLATTGHCPGIFLIKQNTPVAVTIESLIIVWSLSTPAEWENRILEIQL